MSHVCATAGWLVPFGVHVSETACSNYWEHHHDRRLAAAQANNITAALGSIGASESGGVLLVFTVSICFFVIFLAGYCACYVFGSNWKRRRDSSLLKNARALSQGLLANSVRSSTGEPSQAPLSPVQCCPALPCLECSLLAWHTTYTACYVVRVCCAGRGSAQAGR